MPVPQFATYTSENNQPMSIAFDTVGNPANPPMILIMGLGKQLTSWNDQFCKAFAEAGFWIIRTDHRDVGLSSHFDAYRPSRFHIASSHLFNRPLGAAYTLSEMGHDILAVMDHLKIKDAHIFGASMGGMIGQHLAIEHPHRVKSLISVMSTTGNLKLPRARLDVRVRLLRSSPLTLQPFLEQTFKMARMLAGPVYVPDEEMVKALAARNFSRAHNPFGGRRHLGAVIASGDRSQLLTKVTTPTLVIHGTRDPLIPVECGMHTAKMIPDAKLELIPDMGHDVPYLLWPKIIDTTTEFCKSI